MSCFIVAVSVLLIENVLCSLLLIVNMPISNDTLLFLSDQATLNQYFHLLCNCLPDDYQSTLDKLKSISQLSNDDHQQLGTMISSSCEAQLVKERIVTFLVVKLCFNGNGDSLVGLCDVMDNLTKSGQSATRVQNNRSGM